MAIKNENTTIFIFKMFYAIYASRIIFWMNRRYIEHLHSVIEVCSHLEKTSVNRGEAIDVSRFRRFESNFQCYPFVQVILIILHWNSFFKTVEILKPMWRPNIELVSVRASYKEQTSTTSYSVIFLGPSDIEEQNGLPLMKSRFLINIIGALCIEK